MMRLFSPRQTVMSGDIRIAGCDIMALHTRQLSDIHGTTVAMIFLDVLP